MNWRVRFLALAILTLFTGFGLLYYKTFVKKRAHGIILIVANGLDLNTLNMVRQQSEAARSEAKSDFWTQPARYHGLSTRHILNIEGLPRVAILNVQGLGQAASDEAATSTALACGQRVKNGLVGCNSLDQMLDTVIYAAQRSNRSTGLVTTSSLVDNTPVAFYTYMRDPREKYRAAAALVDSAHIDVVLGGGSDYFTPANVLNEAGRTDGRDLVQDAERQGYTVVHTADELRKVPTWPTWRTRQLFGLFAPQTFIFSGAARREIQQQPSLPDMTRTAIQCLQYNINGYFLVVEQGLIATAAKQNLTDIALNEAAALDQTIKVAIEYAGPEALIIVTNNYSLGALAETVSTLAPPSTTSPTQRRLWTKTPPRASIAEPAIWLTGPGAPRTTPPEIAWFNQRIASGAFSTNSVSVFTPDSAIHFSTEAVPTASPAWMASRGFGSAQLTGFFSNTDLYYILQEFF